MITLDLREAIQRAAAIRRNIPDPKLRPAGEPGRYATPIAFSMAAASASDRGGGPGTSASARAIARALAERLGAEPFIETATVTGDGFVTITVTRQALARVAARVITAGPACTRSDILNGVIVPAPPTADWARAPAWEQARAILAAQLTLRLAVRAGATPRPGGSAGPGGAPERAVPGAASRIAAPAGLAQAHAGGGGAGEGKGRSGGEAATGLVREAIGYAGADAVRFALARAVPGRPVTIDAAGVARQVPGNPAYAVRYAHARAVSGLRWAAPLGATGEAVQPCPPADPADWALLDALSWLPERVATAARRGRPAEFARYLEDLASATVTALPFPGAGQATAPGDSERLALTRELAAAARTGLAAGLDLLGVSAPQSL